MGGQFSAKGDAKELYLANWIYATEDYSSGLFANINHYRRRLLSNNTTHDLIEYYELQFNSDLELESYINDSEWRKVKYLVFESESLNQPNEKKMRVTAFDESLTPSYLKPLSPYIFPLRYFIDNSQHEMCSTIYSGNAYLDKIDLRLKEINDIPFQDQLYLYQAVLEGFKVLNEKFGYFTITEEMIFITKEGKVRVWMNPNPSRNTPYSHDPLGCNLDKKMSMQPRRTHGSQSQMLSCLIQLVEENTDQQLMSRYNYFSRYLLERNLLERLSFYKAVEEFDKYCKENSFIVPECMSSIVDIFQEGIEGPTSSYLLRSSVDNRFPKTNHQEHNDGERLRFSKASSYDGPQLNIESRHEFGDKNGYQFNIGQRPAKYIPYIASASPRDVYSFGFGQPQLHSRVPLLSFQNNPTMYSHEVSTQSNQINCIPKYTLNFRSNSNLVNIPEHKNEEDSNRLSSLPSLNGFMGQYRQSLQPRMSVQYGNNSVLYQLRESQSRIPSLANSNHLWNSQQSVNQQNSTKVTVKFSNSPTMTPAEPSKYLNSNLKTVASGYIINGTTRNDTDANDATRKNPTRNNVQHNNAPNSLRSHKQPTGTNLPKQMHYIARPMHPVRQNIGHIRHIYQYIKTEPNTKEVTSVKVITKGNEASANKKVHYYSNDNTYILDQEIVADLYKYLGYVAS